jgi:2-dehydro-3-deoxyphosphogluconate aldolase / (4S)-4-hydroxy-2-oxoglutarate aldolase
VRIVFFLGSAMPLYAHERETAKIMALAPVIPVLTVASVEDGLAQAKALIAGGLYAIEVTLRTPSALEAIKAIANNIPDAVVGAGTIVSADQINQAVAAGAKFLVSPGAPAVLANAAAQSPVPFLPGCATASEAMALMELGFRALKLFPAEAAGGVKLLASLAAPLPNLRFCPTGGIDLEKAPEYLRLPNVPCVGGSWMLQKAALAAGDGPPPRYTPAEGSRCAALGGCRCGLGLSFGALLGDFALELDRVLRKLRLVGLDEEIVEAAAMLDRTQGRRGDPQAHRALEHIRDKRDLDEVGQEARAGLAVGMADLVAGLNGDSSQLAAACHRTTILQTNASARSRQI